MSTGTKRSMPCTTEYVSKTPRGRAGAHRDAPFRLVHLLPDALQHRQHLHHHSARDNHQVALPRTEPKHLGANRAKSCRLAPVAISSIPQQAVAKGMGHKLFLRHQLATSSTW